MLAGTPRDGLKFGEDSSLVSQGTGRGWGYAQHMSNVRADSEPSLTGTADEPERTECADTNLQPNKPNVPMIGENLN